MPVRGHYNPNVSLNLVTSAILKGTQVTVRLPGTTTLATIYSSRTGGAKANPFTTHATTGNFDFWAVPGDYDLLINGVTERVTVHESAMLNVGLYVKGDGVTDDTSAYQSALLEAANQSVGLEYPSGIKIRTVRNVYQPGTVNHVGRAGAEVILDADLTAADGDTYWFNFGIPSKGGTPSTYSGFVEGLRFRLTAAAKVRRLLNFHKADTAGVIGCRFDTSAMTAPTGGSFGGPIGFYNDGGWCSSPGRTKLWIVRNAIFGPNITPNGSEGIGVGDCSHLWVLDNEVYGVGDDAIGLHTCDHFVVRGNNCRTPQGRLYFSNCRDFRAVDNLVERIPKADSSINSGGGLIYLDVERPGTNYPCCWFTVARNELILPAVASTTYGIRLQGARNGKVDDNIFRYANANGKGITVEKQTLAGWADAEGIEPDTTARARNIGISGNRSVGSVAPRIETVGAAADIPGPIDIGENAMGSYTVPYLGSKFRISNTVNDGVANNLTNVHGRTVIDADTLFEVTVNLAAGSSVMMNQGALAALDRWYPKRAGIIFALEVTFGQALTAGTATFYLYKNGVSDPLDGIGIGTSLPRGTRLNYYQGVNNRFVAGDYIQIQAVGAGNTPSPLACHVKALGMYSAGG